MCLCGTENPSLHCFKLIEKKEEEKKKQFKMAVTAKELLIIGRIKYKK